MNIKLAKAADIFLKKAQDGMSMENVSKIRPIVDSTISDFMAPTETFPGADGLYSKNDLAVTNAFEKGEITDYNVEIYIGPGNQVTLRGNPPHYVAEVQAYFGPMLEKALNNAGVNGNGYVQRNFLSGSFDE